MGIVTADISVTLDGFGAGPNQRLDAPFGDIDEEPLHSWMFIHAADSPAEIAAITDASAFIMGRNMCSTSCGCTSSRRRRRCRRLASLRRRPAHILERGRRADHAPRHAPDLSPNGRLTAAVDTADAGWAEMFPRKRLQRQVSGSRRRGAAATCPSVPPKTPS